MLRLRRILLLVNYRPEYQHEWSGKTYFSQLRLDPLGKEQAEEMLTVLLGEVRRETYSMQRPYDQAFILDKTEGNPFFMEEIVQDVARTGSIDRQRRVRACRLYQYADLRLPDHCPRRPHRPYGSLTARRESPAANTGGDRARILVEPAYAKSSPNLKTNSTACSRVCRQVSLSTNSPRFLTSSTSSSMP